MKYYEVLLECSDLSRRFQSGISKMPHSKLNLL